MPSQKLKPIKYLGYTVLVNTDLGYFPYFLRIARGRITQELALNVVITGEAGIGKSYIAISMCRMLSPKFGIEDVVSTYSEYMDAIRREEKQGVPILFDEPQYAIDKRDWYNQVNKALVKTMTSQRFMLRPVFIPIINLNMLDKMVRSYLIQFHIVIHQRGRGIVYRLSSSQFEEKTYRQRLCSIKYGLFDFQCGIKSCLKCKKLQDCKMFRAQYERKKKSWQEIRFDADYEKALIDEKPSYKNSDLIKILLQSKMLIKPSGGKYEPAMIIDCLIKEIGLEINMHKAYDLIRMIKAKDAPK